MKLFTTAAATLLLVSTLNVQAQAQGIQTQSGLLLGVYVQAVNQGMYVTSTIPGYSAVGRLHPGDILMRATADGQVIYNLRSLRELEMAKSAIGPNREAAIEFFRPGYGVQYAWVEFTPLMGPAAVSSSGVKQYGAQFKLESEKPGARNMFKKGSSNPPKGKPGGNPFNNFNQKPGNQGGFGNGGGGSKNPGSLFGR
ncbi:hypothetical protein KOR42_38230 [Thalassoglobus neptunius]|uniref:PDZ domain-containing protein n=1 Tax=Thalassoglobus neptunius TaxID=1938619 RepID=A0A5C5WIN3_9PLAN|nr:hypothetical protein [Thalassoglobus neptunius]TWT49871.1 hypothetical protein KOR42_38230 [Thalassoglobus neptunius]